MHSFGGGRDETESVEQHFRSLVDAAPALIWTTDAAGACSFLSEEWHDYTGQSAAEGLGFGWLEAVHPADRERTRHLFLDANRRCERFTLDHRLLRKDGQYRWVVDSGRPRFSEQGAFLGFVGSVIDVHERRLAELERDRFFDLSVDMLAVASLPDGLWKRVNAAFTQTLGWTEEELLTMPFRDIVHPADLERSVRALETLADGRRVLNFEHRVLCKDGGYRWIAWNTAPQIEMGMMYCVGRDITERIRSEAALRQSDRRKEEFLAVLGHELRNPLAPLQSGLDLLAQSRGNPELTESVRAMMERQLSHLVHLVDDLLDVSRISRGTVELQRAPLDVDAVIEIAVEQAQPLVKSRRHELIVERAGAPLPVNGDFQRITQIVYNLLSNAAKYTEPQGRIVLRTGVDNGHAVLSVSDNGYGIPAAQLDEIFEMFSQIDIHRSRTGGGGLGVGLALSRQLAIMHGGTLMARSDGLGKGSEFVLRLPHSISAGEKNPAPVAARAARITPRRVLVVDDNLDAAQSLKAVLTNKGHWAEAAHDGPAALSLFESFRPEVVLLDIGMPIMDGYEVARRIRAAPLGQQTLLIALTGWGQAEDKQRARDAGFDEHLTKPVDGAALENLIACCPPNPNDHDRRRGGQRSGLQMRLP